MCLRCNDCETSHVVMAWYSNYDRDLEVLLLKCPKCKAYQPMSMDELRQKIKCEAYLLWIADKIKPMNIINRDEKVCS